VVAGQGYRWIPGKSIGVLDSPGDSLMDAIELDCMNLISKTPGLPDAQVTKPDSPFQPANCLFANG